MNDKNLLEIDGSFGEGGGAILRIGAGFSVLYYQPIRIKNIRANRPKPGLRLQHLLGLQTLANLTNSTLSECKVGTKEITFVPNDEVNNKLHVNINTAASIGLLLQPIQIACLGFRKSGDIEITLSGGGTFGKWAPSLHYLQKVTYPIFRKSGVNIAMEVQKHGWYPKGGARVHCIISPPKEKLKSVELTELGNIESVFGEIIITDQLRQNRNNIVERTRKSIKRQLKKYVKAEITIKHAWVKSNSSGVGLSLWAESDSGAIISSGTILGEKKLSSEKLGILAADELIKYIKNDIPVDNYLSDQLIPLMAQIKDPSRIKVLEVTKHARTNLELIKQITNRNYSILEGKKNHFFIEYS
jgi:RNA 3'-terminal phosphate cyclase (ATP)/RNA 3'-terminal phosphate cyclase (GTP)